MLLGGRRCHLSSPASAARRAEAHPSLESVVPRFASPGAGFNRNERQELKRFARRLKARR
jgi:hypothetical protein